MTLGNGVISILGNQMSMVLDFNYQNGQVFEATKLELSAQVK